MAEEEKKFEKKLCVYICTGCGIGDNLDIDALKKVAEDQNIDCKVHECLCGKAGLDMIKNDVNSGYNTLVIAACSPRVNWDVFNFEGCIVERVNLREGVVWSHDPGEETQALAEDYIRMGIVKAQKTDIPEPYLEETSKTIMVVGGGVTGMTAALEAAEAGYDVVLVEKEAELGGWAAKFHKLTSFEKPFNSIVDVSAIQEMINKVESNPKIKVYKSTKIQQISGQPGMFDVALETPSGTAEERIGAIVLATGWKPYDASKLESLGYGKYSGVVTNIEFEEMAKEGRVGGDVLFIQCAGQRDPEHLPYCSSVCCMVSLKQAKYVTENGGNAYIIYKDMRTPGLYEEFYKTMQDDEKIFLTKGEVKSITENNGKLVVEVENTLLGETLKLEVDTVVLATGMVSTMKGIYTIKEEFPDDGNIPYSHIEKKELTPELVEELKQGEHILNLQYRQGPEIPTLRYGMPDSNYICFPYESRRTGIYAAGCVRAPMPIAECIEDAKGAALKAIQCVELVSEGKTTFPRTGDIDYPQFFLQRCTQCKRCTEECPFGALDEDEKGTPQPNPLRCRRCGICFGACPEKIISFKGYSIDMISSMIKAIDVPYDDQNPKYRIVAFFCENDAYPALDMAALNGLKWSTAVRVIPVRCLGSVNVVFIADALSRGIDGILMVGCKYGEDYQCHFIRGSELANRRMENVQETLQRLMLEPERVKLVELAISDFDKVPEIIDGFVEEIRQVGPNPYKGF